MSEPVYVISEIGSTHDGDLEKALNLIRDCAKRGANAVKFQYWSSPEKLAKNRNAAKYLDVYKKYKMPELWFGKLRSMCQIYGVDFMCTSYLTEDVEAVAYYVDRFKIASFEFLNWDFIFTHLKYDKPIYISTGMANSEEIYALVEPLSRENVAVPVTLMHCTSSYPAPIEGMNLSVIGDLRRYISIPLKVGYSDHAAVNMIESGALAVAAGATAIEVHVRHDSTAISNPDYGHSLTMDSLGEYVHLVRRAEVAMGSPIKRAQPCETEMSKYRVKV